MNETEKSLEDKVTLAMESGCPGSFPFFAEIPLTQLNLNDYNARRFEENMTPQRRSRLEELVSSVREKGIIEPLLVRPIAVGHYEIIAGERRYRAARQVVESGGTSPDDYLVPCMVRNVDEDEAFNLMLVENLQREDLTPFEAAQAFKHYLERHGNSADAVNDLSLRTGIPVHAIRRQVRLLDLPEEVLAAWRDGDITQSHAELFTRVGDNGQALELLVTCKRLKLSTRELAERIGLAIPDLERGFFDKEDCRTCHFNTEVQSGLFTDIVPGGKCGNSSCFEIKQHDFLVKHWPESKAAKSFGTRGFRFGHRTQDRLDPIISSEPADRCLECEAFVSILRLNGAIVSGYARTCIGPKVCFDELYRAAPPETEKPSPETQEWEPETKEPKTKTEGTKPETKSPSNKNTPPEETGPVFSASRGEKFRESFFREAIPPRVMNMTPEAPHAYRLTILALALGSTAARTCFTAARGLKIATPEAIAKEAFEIPPGELTEEMRRVALAHVLDSSVSAEVRRIIAEQIGIDLSSSWEMTREYLVSLNKSEIIRVGEEPGIEIFRDEKVVDFRRRHHKGKALHALKKEELIEMILKSGAPLKGLVPAEVLGTPKG